MPANTEYPEQSATKVKQIFNTDHAAADEGSFFVATNPVSGTTIAMTTSVVDDALTASSTHAPAAPLLFIQNKGSVGDVNTRSIYLRYIKLKQPIAAQAWTSATSAHYSFRGDTISRYTSGGSTIVPVNINMSSSRTSGVTMYFGALVTALPGPATGRILGLGLIQGTIPLPGDCWTWTFGNSEMPTHGLGASAIKNVTFHCGPIIIGPGCNLAMDVWAIALAAAPAFEFEVGWIERYAGL